jgi:hypothetical protein
MVRKWHIKEVGHKFVIERTENREDRDYKLINNQTWKIKPKWAGNSQLECLDLGWRRAQDAGL